MVTAHRVAAAVPAARVHWQHPSGGISSASTRMKIGGRRARLGGGSHHGGLAVVRQQFGGKPVAFDGGECHTVVGGKLGKLL
jgi:hypothetical protein